MKAALKVDSLTIRTSGKQEVIVHPISFEVISGEVVNLVGKTGSGKSLIAQAMLGTLTEGLLASGRVCIDDVEYLGKPEKERRKLWGKKISLLPQEPWLSLNPTKRSSRQLSEVYQFVKGKKRKGAESAAIDDLKRFAIHSAKDNYPHELSGGMAQRLVFCCTMAGGAQILIVDEPTKGLDSDRKQEVILHLQEFLCSGGALLVITHDVEVAEQLGGQTIVMKDGVVLDRDDTLDLFAAPKKEYTKALVDAVPKNWAPRAKTNHDDPSPLISCKGISKSYSQQQLFSDVNLDILRKEIVGLYGASGSGKSTLGDILLNLVRPDAGEVVRYHKFKPFQYLKLYQDPPASFSPFHSVKSSLGDFMNLHNLEWYLADRLLNKLNLDHSLLGRKPCDISGGELQRLAILRSLLLDPVFLFADEPTSRLDPLTQKDTMTLMCDVVQQKNCSMLLVSHDFDLLESCCDRVMDLNVWKVDSPEN